MQLIRHRNASSMNAASQNKTPIQPKNLAQLLPSIKDIITKESAQLVANQTCYFTSKTSSYKATTEQKIRPLTIAELKTLTGPSQKVPLTVSTKKKPWNSSVKVDKRKSRTANEQMKHSTARKVLTFQSKSGPNTVYSNRITKIPSTTKNVSHAQAKSNILNRISGINKIPETPVINRLPAACLPEKKLRNTSFKCSNDDSFLQKEKEINDFEEKSNALTEEATLEKIAEISPPVSTPFKEYRNVRDYFSHTCDTDNSVLYKNNTIVSSFDKSTKEYENIMLSLREILEKVAVVNSDVYSKEHNKLRELKIKTQNDIYMIEYAIGLLTSRKAEHLKTLHKVNKLIIDQMSTLQENNTTATITPHKSYAVRVKEVKNNTDKSPLSRDTVIKSKSPSYKIPRKSICLQKKVFHKSMPNVSNTMQTPIKNTDKALDMYMKMKQQQITFLNTPVRKHCHTEMPDTPAVTSHNLQKQLDKLYNEL